MRAASAGSAAGNVVDSILSRPKLNPSTLRTSTLSVAGSPSAPWSAVSPPRSARISAHLTASLARPSPVGGIRTSCGDLIRRRCSSEVSAKPFAPFHW
jgi:hypothetical protein